MCIGKEFDRGADTCAYPFCFNKVIAAEELCITHWVTGKTPEEVKQMVAIDKRLKDFDLIDWENYQG